MGDFTEERERDDYGQRSLTPAQFAVALDGKRNGDFLNYISCIFISTMIYTTIPMPYSFILKGAIFRAPIWVIEAGEDLRAPTPDSAQSSLRHN